MHKRVVLFIAMVAMTVASLGGCYGRSYYAEPAYAAPYGGGPTVIVEHGHYYHRGPVGHVRHRLHQIGL